MGRQNDAYYLKINGKICNSLKKDWGVETTPDAVGRIRSRFFEGATLESQMEPLIIRIQNLTANKSTKVEEYTNALELLKIAITEESVRNDLLVKQDLLVPTE